MTFSAGPESAAAAGTAAAGIAAAEIAAAVGSAGSVLDCGCAGELVYEGVLGDEVEAEYKAS